MHKQFRAFKAGGSPEFGHYDWDAELANKRSDNFRRRREIRKSLRHEKRKFLWDKVL